jgi:BirA family biotin operon repressor/biotin-[acetyl-CoA-carboxylase] ligase
MIHWHDHLVSTMDEAHRLAEAGAPHGTAVAAKTQSGGRGSRGRSWASPEGGLWLSVLCRPPGARSMERLSVRAGEAIAAVLQAALPGLPPVTVKLPNDLLVDGRKLAGILCEARWEGDTPLWVVIGVGINVLNPVPAPFSDTAVSLAGLGVETTPEAVADLVMPALREVGAAAGG